MPEKAASEDKRFYPDYLSEILVVIFLVLGAVLVLALLFPPGIGREINFSAAYQPKPEWYLLWSYQLLGYFHGKWTFVGTVLIPLLAMAILFSIPFMDRKASGSSRIIAIVCFTLVISSFIVLTILPALSR